jgi:predicted RNase H-like HicB family nuclease
MHYPAIITVEESHITRLTFPDFPGVERFLDSAENVVTQAQETLENHLLRSLAQGVTPPPPSANVKAPEHAMILQVPLSPGLAHALELRWLKDLPAHG